MFYELASFTPSAAALAPPLIRCFINFTKPYTAAQDVPAIKAPIPAPHPNFTISQSLIRNSTLPLTKTFTGCFCSAESKGRG